MSATLYTGEALDVLRTLPDGVARCCVTSPPYFSLRDYGVDGQLGLEATPEAYVERLVAVMREVRRVLTDDGTLWLNLGDSYAANRGYQVPDSKHRDVGNGRGMRAEAFGVKQKDLLGIPWLVAFALRADGWYLRSDLIWEKPNCMPESVTDRPTRSHEYVFLLSKSRRYFYDAEAIAERLAPASVERLAQDVESQAGSTRAHGGTRAERPMKAVRRSGNKARKHGEDADRPGSHLGRSVPWEDTTGTRNARSVWMIPTKPYSGAHFATMPPELARRCIMAGSAPGDTVLDPFGGSGTTASVAVGCGRKALHIELNPAYRALAVERIGPAFVESAA